jgi:hypothetical protein
LKKNNLEVEKHLRVIDSGTPGPMMGDGENCSSPEISDLQKTATFSLGDISE